nr:MEKHLA domain-containing protein [Paraburkholderia phosphatilytica]
MRSLATSQDFAILLADSYQRLVDESLVPPHVCVTDLARWLYAEAPFVVLAHNTEDDPRFVYANQAAQRCFEYDWDEFVTLHSRQSAEQPDREERARLLEDVRRDGYSANYRGQRIARSGRRFWIEKAVVWNLVDHHGEFRGQAATFSEWTDVPGH